MKLCQFIPDTEKWLHTPEAKAALNEGLAWAAGHPARATNLDKLEARVLAKRPARKAAKRKVAA